VVRQLDLDIRRGEFLTLPALGSGKTTTLMMLAGFESPTAGEIVLDGKPITRTPPPSAFRHGVPELRAVPAPDGGPERGLPADGARLAKDEQAGGRSVPWDGAAQGHGRALPGPAVGRQQQRVAWRGRWSSSRSCADGRAAGALDKQLREHMQIELKELTASSA